MSAILPNTCESAKYNSVGEYRPGPHEESISLTVNDTAIHVDELKELELPSPVSIEEDNEDVPSNKSDPVCETDGDCVWLDVGI